jgi:DNA replication and repair protein RecF
MFLRRLTLTNFKNYNEADLEFSPRINCFVGDNGVGKTNILDAIHYLSLTKSYFTAVDSVNVRHSQDYFIVKGVFDSEDISSEVYCGYQKDKRKVVKRDGKEYSRLSDHIGRYPVVMLSPADSIIITDGSEERRKFVNNVISQYNRDYLENVIRYNKALKTRNRLLKDMATSNRFDSDVLSVWENQMVEPADKIYEARRSFVDELVPVFQRYYDHISESREKVQLGYRSQLEGTDYSSLLKGTINKDRMLQYTSSGIHRDDLTLLMDEYAIRDLGSQGQQKSYMVALKLAKFDYIMSKGGIKPILLMDDVFDKFDENRVAQIIKLVSDKKFGQIFITDTHQERLQRILAKINIDFRLFKINNGVEEVIKNGK